MSEKTLVKLQNILLPEGQPYTSLYRMYDRGEMKKVENGVMELEKGDVFDGSTYFNACSAGKWFEYSEINGILLKLEVEGDFSLILTGHRVEDVTPVEENARFALEHTQTVLAKKEYILSDRAVIEVQYPKVDEGLVAFSLVAHGPCRIYGGCYQGEISQNKVRNVVLTMSITTFRKEEFVLPNIELLKKEILESEDEMADNFYVHVVDNGRTILDKNPGHSHITIHGNNNVGGSGGYARGMIETLKQPVKATHILLMDDDVLIQTESIKRTYTLLKVLKEEYRDRFVSGAMLFYENMHVQHEDVGYVDQYGSYGPVKPAMDFYKIEDCCYNEVAPLNREHMYAGWWYCCIPMQYVREDNLPLPLFVRGDDVEYSLRNNAKFLTMNGICVWHMGFTQKFNAAMELYQVHRNSLIYQAVSGVCTECNFINRMEYFVRAELQRFNYNSAELLLDALDDFMKGPEFIKQPLGESIVKEKGKKNEKLKALSEIDGIDFSKEDIDVKNLYNDAPYSKAQYIIHRLTYNKHYFHGKDKGDIAVIPYDWFCAIGKQYGHNRLLAVNPHTFEGALRVMDKKRFKEIMKRQKKTFKKVRKNFDTITKQYRDCRAELTSISFWNEYLK